MAKDEPVNQFWVAHGDVEGYESARRVAEEDRARDAEYGTQCGDVICHLFERAGLGRDRRGAALSAQVDDLDTVQETIERSAIRDWGWTAVERLPESQRVTVMLRHFSTASSYSTIADICDVPIGTVRSRLNAARRRLADELLATAAAAYPERNIMRGWSLAAGNAMLAFERSGDPKLLESVFTTDVAFRMADRVERRGRANLAAGLAHDFDDGVTAHLLRVIPGEHVAITELILRSPPDKPLHCPPAVTQVHYHHTGRTHRLVSHYAPHP